MERSYSEIFINSLVKARGFSLADAELIYEKFKDTNIEKSNRADHDAERFILNLTSPLIEKETKILEDTMLEAMKTFNENIGTNDIVIDLPSLSIQESFEVFKTKVLFELKDENK